MLMVRYIIEIHIGIKMDYWKTKVLPKIKKVLDTSGPKKAAAAEACKIFDDSKVLFFHICKFCPFISNLFTDNTNHPQFINAGSIQQGVGIQEN